MLKFEKEQKIYDIAGLKIGGQPGEYPTVLIGSIFYGGHKIVENAEKGIFNKQRAEELISKQEEMSDVTGIPCILDVVGEHPDALMKYIDFVSETTDAPFLLDGVEAGVRMQALRHAVNAGLRDRIVYNSISKNTKEEEIKAIRDSKIKTAIVSAFSDDPSPEGKVNLLNQIPGKKGLLELAKEAGVIQPLIDTAVLDIPSIGLSSMAIQLVKHQFGIPVGCGPANGMSLWTKARISKEFYKLCEASAMLFAQSFGADFILYGPIESANTVFPAVATFDGILAYTAKWVVKTKPKTMEHPLFKIL